MDHLILDERALAMDRLVASRLRENPALLDRVQATLERWMVTASPPVQPVLLEWKSILSGPLSSILTLLESEDARATRLRQSSPFCGILTQEERTRILLKYRSHESHST